MKKLLLVKCVVLLAVLVLSPVVSAIPLWNVNFNDDTVGTAPAIAAATAGIVNTKPTYLLPSTATILVQNSFTGGSASLSDKPVVFDGPGWFKMQFGGAPLDGELNADYCMEFDLLVPSATLSGTSGIFTALIRSPSANIANITLQTTDMRAVLISNQAGAGSLETQMETYNNVWQTDKVMHVGLQLNTAIDKVQAYIDGVKIGEILIAPTATSGYRNVRTLSIEAGGSGDDPFAVDNIVGSGTLIPEPATMMLLLAGFIGLRKRH
ncbi:MAG: PEP-CTERM sorting domain-containing protein [Planctomycetota bacterium]